MDPNDKHCQMPISIECQQDPDGQFSEHWDASNHFKKSPKFWWTNMRQTPDFCVFCGEVWMDAPRRASFRWHILREETDNKNVKEPSRQLFKYCTTSLLARSRQPSSFNGSKKAVTRSGSNKQDVKARGQLGSSIRRQCRRHQLVHWLNDQRLLGDHRGRIKDRDLLQRKQPKRAP
ncbi:hypothetical protein pipiens_007179 [Culex pipiens pipiens]|uniref:Uncharacterized protein n=1 Tax=Culex pipiens pipiens TaxID=38569 RepID=A0ABD1DM44_CULPP